MKKMQILLRVIGVSQLVLGVLFLVIPQWFIVNIMGLSMTETDINYVYSMLSARFIAYGIGCFYIAKHLKENIFWINNMIFIQIIDLIGGLIYVSLGYVAITDALFPMFNAFVFILLLFLGKRKIECYTK